MYQSNGTYIKHMGECQVEFFSFQPFKEFLVLQGCCKYFPSVSAAPVLVEENMRTNSSPPHTSTIFAAFVDIVWPAPAPLSSWELIISCIQTLHSVASTKRENILEDESTVSLYIVGFQKISVNINNNRFVAKFHCKNVWKKLHVESLSAEAFGDEMWSFLVHLTDPSLQWLIFQE